MPALCMYLSEEEINFLVVKSAKNYEFYNLPFAFSKGSYTDITKEQDFYDEVLSHVYSRFELKVKDTDLAVAYLINPPAIKRRVNYLSDLQSLSADFSENLIYLVTKNYLLVGANSYSASKTPQLFKDSHRNMMSNLSLYSQSLILDNDTVNLIDTNIRNNAMQIETHDEDFKNILFTGSRFTEVYKDEIEKYLLALDMVRGVGQSLLKLDRDNFYPLLALLKKFDTTLYDKIITDLDYEIIGTLLNIPGSAEVLIKSDGGGSQLMELSAGKVAVIPLENSQRAHVLVKSPEFGSSDYEVTGGSLGLIVDTRKKIPAMLNDPENKKQYVELRTQIGDILDSL